MPPEPLVTVLMAVFNDALFLEEAVSSILNQTVADFEFLIIDDGSTDESPEILARFNDVRLRLIRNPHNLGLTRSLQLGVTKARGRYLARMDADDVAFPRRLEEQLAYLENHPQVAILGGACCQMNEQGKFLQKFSLPATDLAIRWRLLLANPFLHSTVMVRRQSLVDGDLNYHESFETAQDYDLWSRLLRRHSGANLKTPLIRYRIRQGVTSRKRPQQLRNSALISQRNLAEAFPGRAFSLEEIEGLLRILQYPDAGQVEGQWEKSAVAYREIFQLFAQKHAGKEGLSRVGTEAGLAIMLSLFRRHFPPGWWRALQPWLLDFPLLPLHLAAYFLGALKRRMESLGPDP